MTSAYLSVIAWRHSPICRESKWKGGGFNKPPQKISPKWIELLLFAEITLHHPMEQNNDSVLLPEARHTAP
ncbi:hypothetical protein AALA80_19010, partial [Oscillospiraceae bacterium 50-60]